MGLQWSRCHTRRFRRKNGNVTGVLTRCTVSAAVAACFGLSVPPNLKVQVEFVTTGDRASSRPEVRAISVDTNTVRDLEQKIQLSHDFGQFAERQQQVQYLVQPQ
jgi:hypothetical protein